MTVFQRQTDQTNWWTLWWMEDYYRDDMTIPNNGILNVGSPIITIVILIPNEEQEDLYHYYYWWRMTLVCGLTILYRYHWRLFHFIPGGDWPFNSIESTFITIADLFGWRRNRAHLITNFGSPRLVMIVHYRAHTVLYSLTIQLMILSVRYLLNTPLADRVYSWTYSEPICSHSITYIDGRTRHCWWLLISPYYDTDD